MFILDLGWTKYKLQQGSHRAFKPQFIHLKENLQESWISTLMVMEWLPKIYNIVVSWSPLLMYTRCTQESWDFTGIRRIKLKILTQLYCDQTAPGLQSAMSDGTLWGHDLLNMNNFFGSNQVVFNSITFYLND